MAATWFSMLVFGSASETLGLKRGIVFHCFVSCVLCRRVGFGDESQLVSAKGTLMLRSVRSNDVVGVD